MTIPDTIDLIKRKYKRLIDIPLSWMETIGSKMSCYAWNKRWSNREKELVIMTLRRKYVNSTLSHKKCKRCSKVFPRTSEYFYPKKHRTNKGRKEFDTACIKCENERIAKWRVINAKKKNILNNRYRNSERGYFMELWNSTKQSKHGNEFKDFDSFFNHWVEQQKTYGTRCPYLNIEMTRKKGMNKPGFRGRTCPTNISRGQSR